MDSEFMRSIATGFAGCGLKVVRFAFPYMIERREIDTRRPPYREPILREAWPEVIHSLGADKPVIGGTSLGGRIASLIADGAEVASYRLPKKIEFYWLPDGDHSFKRCKLSGRSQEDNWNDAIRIVAELAEHQTT